MDNLIINCTCPGCKQPFSSYLQQPLSAASSQPAYWISTCLTPDCQYSGVTLGDGEWTKLISDTTMQAKYQEAVRIRRMSPAELRVHYAAKVGV